jgi:hypothetical protein
MAASAGDQEMTHARPSATASRAGMQMQGFHPDVCACPMPGSGRMDIVRACA